MTIPDKDPRDPSQELLRDLERHPLDVFFKPRSVAVIGASERAGSVGRTVLWNLISNPFGGAVYPVNPKQKSVLGIRASHSLSDLPERVDLAVIATPAAGVPEIIRECAAAGVRGAIVISAGFKEVGPDGARLEQEILRVAREARIRVMGPNCLGLMNPCSGLNATFAGSMARKGSVAFLSQSGALLTAILDWSLETNAGFSAFASLGSMLDLGFGDFIDYLGRDGNTKSILIYMESIGDARAFLSAARSVALRKPIIVLKAGRTAQAVQAAVSHTGALAGSDEVLSAAFRRAGILRVESIADLFEMADTLAKQPRPSGKRLTIITNAGGPGVLATDALVLGGGDLSLLSPAAKEQLDALLPASWSHANPVDILGDADPERYAKALEIAGDDRNSDGLLVVLTPQDMTDPTLTADRLKPFAHRSSGKPVLASWMGGPEVAAGRRILWDAGIPTFAYPDAAARIFNSMWQYAGNLRALYETPSLAEEPSSEAGKLEARAQVKALRAQGRTLLSELESKQLLALYGIPCVETRLALTADEAARNAESLGYPVVVKLHSRSLTHKSDLGGVKLDLLDKGSVHAAFESIRARLLELGKSDGFEGVTVQKMVRRGGCELIVGSSIDPQFGPVLLFGSGGTLVEVYQDRSLGLPPLNTTLARRLMERTRIYEALRGVRGQKPVDLAALEKLLVRFSQLVVEEPAIREIDLNPLLASPEGIVALDARVVLHGPEVVDARLPRTAIRPYPTQYVSRVGLRSGGELTVRPIRPEDEPKMIQFHSALSEESVYLRYAGFMKLDGRVAHERLARICFIDYEREMALVVEREGTDAGPSQLVAVGRLIREPGTRDAEFALLVSDAVQKEGLGSFLLSRLIEIGRDWGMERITAEILARNEPMRRLCKKLGFVLHSGEMVHAVKVLEMGSPDLG
jgi:acetyltransferase